jgi:hypothetical protein
MMAVIREHDVRVMFHAPVAARGAGLSGSAAFGQVGVIRVFGGHPPKSAAHTSLVAALTQRLGPTYRC